MQGPEKVPPLTPVTPLGTTGVERDVQEGQRADERTAVQLLTSVIVGTAGPETKCGAGTREGTARELLSPVTSFCTTGIERAQREQTNVQQYNYLPLSLLAQQDLRRNVMQGAEKVPLENPSPPSVQQESRELYRKEREQTNVQQYNYLPQSLSVQQDPRQSVMPGGTATESLTPVTSFRTRVERAVQEGERAVECTAV